MSVLPMPASDNWLSSLGADNRGAKPVAPKTDGCGLPTIKANNRELRDVSAECLEAIRAANYPPTLFVRSGALVYVATDEDGRHSIAEANESYTRGCLTRCANFFRVVQVKKGEFEPRPISPPLDAVRDLLMRPQDEWGLPPLASVTEAPMLRPDGSILLTPGYDPSTRVFYCPSADLKLPTISPNPSRADIDGAIAVIEDAIGQFPFADNASRAGAYAMLLTPILRRSIEGNVPIALIDAPQAGTGKTLLAETCAIIHSGTNAALKPAPGHDDEEWRKTITTGLMTGNPLTVFDNVDHVLKASSLALAVTASIWTDRILGRSEQTVLPQQTTYIVTGNNLILGGDLPRRCYWIRLDAATSRPWQGRDFRHLDLRVWVKGNRGELLGALLTLARAWYSAGKPPAESIVLGSFENWSRAVGGILQLAGIPAFLSNLEKLYEQADPSQEQWEAFLNALRAAFGTRKFTAKEVIEILPSDTRLRDSLPDELADDEFNGSVQKRFGRAFLRKLNRRYGVEGLRIVKVGVSQGTARWAVEVG